MCCGRWGRWIGCVIWCLRWLDVASSPRRPLTGLLLFIDSCRQLFCFTDLFASFHVTSKGEWVFGAEGDER
uniref:Putative secreted protein n=1 Tax=Anopheles darlingi TaxID=43151 RepID=A0A2M4DKG5_ANODA